MKEFKIEIGTTPQLQMKLNQWRHNFTIDIIAMTTIFKDNEYIHTIVVKREPFKKDPRTINETKNEINEFTTTDGDNIDPNTVF